MILKYKMNCQIYYDDKTSSTYIVKRNTKYEIPCHYQDYELMKNIINKTSQGVSLESILKDNMRDMTKTLQYIKFLVDKDIISECREKKSLLQPELMNYITSNFEDYEMIMEQVEGTRFALVDCTDSLKTYLRKMNLKADPFPILSEEVFKEYDVFFIKGNYSEEDLKHLTDKGKRIVVIKELRGSFSLLYLDRYQPEMLRKFEHFHIGSETFNSIAELIFPMNTLLLYLECAFTKQTKNMRYITGDGALLNFDTSEVLM